MPFGAVDVFVAILAAAVAAFSIVALFVAWKPAAGGKGQQDSASAQESRRPTFRPGLLHAAAATNLALCLAYGTIASRTASGAFVGYSVLHGSYAAVLYLSLAAKPGDGLLRTADAQTIVIWALRFFAFVPVFPLFVIWAGSVRDNLRQRDAQRRWHPGIPRFLDDLQRLRQQRRPGGYEMVGRGGGGGGDQAARFEAGNVHRQWERAHLLGDEVLKAIAGYFAQEKSSEEWRRELGYPFDREPLSNEHTPATLLNEATPTQQKNAIFRGLGGILRRGGTPEALRLLEENIRFSFEQSRIAPQKAKGALQALLIMYNEEDTNVGWAEGVVRDSARAYQREGDGAQPAVRDVSCADGVAERMFLDFVQVVRSKCGSPGDAPLSPKMQMVCEVLRRQEGRADVNVSPANLYAALGKWLKFEDAHYATKLPETRRADLIRYLVSAVAPDEHGGERVRAVEERIEALLQREGILDGPSAIDFQAEDKGAAVANMGGA
jgi:hypothetical protein